MKKRIITNYTQEQADLMSRRIRMRIVPFRNARPKSGRRGSPAIPANTQLYAIAYDHINGGFFTYSYLKREDAEKAVENMKLHGTDNEFFYPWNVVQNVEDTLHFGKV